MKRVMVIGAPGTGKSTFAKKLAAKTGLPLIHLDLYYHDKSKNYYENKEAWKSQVEEMTAGECWIIDGNYGRTMAERMKWADTIIYFDLPRALALRGIAKRRLAAQRAKRDDMPSDWHESAGWSFVCGVWNYKKKYGEDIARLLEDNKDKQVVVFKSRKETEEYLNAMIKP